MRVLWAPAACGDGVAQDFSVFVYRAAVRGDSNKNAVRLWVSD